MKFSVSIPTCREGLSLPLPFGNAEDAVGLAVLAEELGYHSVWGNDHITPPAYISEDYANPPQWLEPLSTMAFIAGKTKRIKLGTAVLVLPLRDPVWVAKEVATIDVLSGGRMILCVGVGAYREEFEKLRPRVKANRGEMLTEAMQVLNVIFNERYASFKGKYFEFERLEVYPKPLQKPFPLYSGGNSENELKRAVTLGNGWMAAAITPQKLKESVTKLKRIAEESGRDPRGMEISISFGVVLARTEKEALEQFKVSRMFTHLHTLRTSTLRDQNLNQLVEANLVGSPQQIVDQVGHLEEIGVTLLQQSFQSPNPKAMREQIQFFSEEVMSHFPKASL